MRSQSFETRWGTFGMVVRGSRLVATYLPDAQATIRRRIKQHWPDAVEANNLLPKFRRDVNNYFAGKRVTFALPIDLSDLPPFRRAVLEQCRRIPFGQTASYADLARATGKPGAARAVGGAMAGNPLPLVIPCHRVVRSDGTIGGFSSCEGVKLKERLLLLEHIKTDASKHSLEFLR